MVGNAHPTAVSPANKLRANKGSPPLVDYGRTPLPHLALYPNLTS